MDRPISAEIALWYCANQYIHFEYPQLSFRLFYKCKQEHRPQLLAVLLGLHE